MNIEILTIPLATLETMSDAELAKHFEPFFNVTRPQPKDRVKEVKKVTMNRPMRNKIDDALDMLDKLGIK